MSDNSQRDLDELQHLLAEDPAERQKLLVGLSDALAEHDAAATGRWAELAQEAEQPDDETRAGVVEKLIATGAILYAPPAIAARVLLGQAGSVPPSSFGGGVIP